jgi:hypothetical protein
LLASSLVTALPAHASDPFMKPTKEELEMTSLPGYPGAPAVVLYREEITKDDLHVFQHYERIKILTEDGKKYANVELPFLSTSGNGFDYGDDKTVGDIIGRTIHSDGTIVPFTGKPYLKVIEKEQGFKVQEKIFTLPDVQVGSIIEYRYATRYNDDVYEAPDWFIQGGLYLKSAHFAWYPTSHDLVDGESGQPINAISWFPILPADAKITHTEVPPTGTAMSGPQVVYDLVIKDVPATVHEEFSPPLANTSYRVYFNFTPYRSGADFWKSKGKHWSKELDSFAGPNSDLTNATRDIIAGANTQDEKLRKIYATVMTLENTSFTRERDRREDKAGGLGKTNNAGDVLAHKRGSDTQLTELFIGMARAAGMKAYGMLVPDRSEELFMPGWLNMRQFDALIAIVNVDGKEVFFDPGSRYCPYGRLAWEHTFLPSGLRQTDGGTDFSQTPGDPYTFNKVARVANLTMDSEGQITGKIDLTFVGAPALRWRQVALKGDDESVRHGLKKSLEEMIPRTLEVKVSKIENLEDYEKPLLVTYDTTGTLGTATGKRTILPVDIFQAGESASFPHEKRQLAVYFHYAQMVQDALRINLPPNLTPEAVPDAGKFSIPKEALYSLTVTSTPKNFTTRREFAFNDIIVPVAEYPGLRAFYSQFEAKDQESVVLKPQTAESTATPAAAPGGH